jgi:hypothetical protein
LPPPLIIEVIGDTSSLERSFKTTTLEARRFSGTVKEQASRAIVANAQQREALQKLAAEYRLVANNAKRGSEAQIAASRLAEKAERELASSLGVVGRESRLASGHASRFGKDIDHAGRGALAGSGAFRSLGRSIAFASGGFLAFASAGAFLRKSIDAAKEAQVTQKQLAAQFRASGIDVGDYQKRIDEATNKLSLLSGFQNDQLKASFTTIFRSTQNVTKSLSDIGLAADIARGKQIPLATATKAIAQAETGRFGLLRRLLPEIKAGATAEEALAFARRKFAGQARAGTTDQQRFGAVLHNTEEIIGTGLLPVLNKYLGRLAIWLTKMNESGQLQRDVARATKIVERSIHDVGAVVHTAAGAFNVFAHAVGGAKKAIELLGAAFVVLRAKAALMNAGGISGGFRGIGREAEGSRRKVGLLGAALTDLPATIAITLGITELITQKQKDQTIGAVNKTLGGFAFGPGEKARDGEIRDLGGQKFVVKTIGGQQFLVPLPQKNPLRGQRFTPFGAPARPTIPQSASGAAAGPTLTPAQQRAINLSAQPNNLVFLRAQEAFDKKSIDLLTQRFKSGQIGAKKFKDAVVSFNNDLTQTQGNIQSIIDEQNRKVAEAARKAAEKTRKAAAEARKAARDAATKARKALELSAENAGIFLEGITRGLKLGVDTKAIDAANARAAKAAAKAAAAAKQFTVPEALQVDAARTAALGLGDDAKRVAVKIRAAAQKAIKSGRLGFQGLIDAYNTIGSINDQLKTGANRVTGKFKHVDANKLLAGFDPALRRELAPIVSQIGLGGRVPGRRSIAFGGGGDVVVHTHVSLDGREVATSVTRHQQKDSTRRTGSRRGPFAGRH